MPNFAKFLLACDLIMQLHRTVPPLFFFFRIQICQVNHNLTLHVLPGAGPVIHSQQELF